MSRTSDSRERQLRELEHQIVLGGAEGDMRCKICEQHLPLPPTPLDAEVWALALQTTGRAHAVGHLIEEAQVPLFNS